MEVHNIQPCRLLNLKIQSRLESSFERKFDGVEPASVGFSSCIPILGSGRDEEDVQIQSAKTAARHLRRGVWHVNGKDHLSRRLRSRIEEVIR
jgi:hypothetical protein